MTDLKRRDRYKGHPERSLDFRAPLTSLDDLLAYAEHYANFAMRRSGKIETAFMIISSDGSLMILPATIPDERAKDAFILNAHLVCVVQAATAVVFVSEVWMSKCDRLDDIKPPSESPDREEIVMLLGEGHSENKQKILP